MRNPLITLSATFLLISAVPAIAQETDPPPTEQVIVDDGMGHGLSIEEFQKLVQAELDMVRMTDGKGNMRPYDELEPKLQAIILEMVEKKVRRLGRAAGGNGAADAQPANGLNVSVGDAAPPLNLEGLLQAPDGASVNWEDLKGSAVIVEFWGTWCKPCVRMIPHINELAEEFKDHPVRFVSITFEDTDKINPFLERTPMNSWIGLDTNRDTITAYGVRAWPTTVLVDAQGIIRSITHPNNIDKRTVLDLVDGRIPRLRDPSAPAGAE
jgi:thiol-disulfide isomerase/thioredoxin